MNADSDKYVDKDCLTDDQVNVLLELGVPFSLWTSLGRQIVRQHRFVNPLRPNDTQPILPNSGQNQ